MKPNKITKHHIVPRSRRKNKKLMGVCSVPARQHNLYHQLVGNMTPMEAFVFFNETFWGKYFTLDEYKEWNEY
jgi:hypothetical protein